MVVVVAGAALRKATGAGPALRKRRLGRKRRKKKVPVEVTSAAAMIWGSVSLTERACRFAECFAGHADLSQYPRASEHQDEGGAGAAVSHVTAPRASLCAGFCLQGMLATTEVVAFTALVRADNLQDKAGVTRRTGVTRLVGCFLREKKSENGGALPQYRPQYRPSFAEASLTPHPSGGSNCGGGYLGSYPAGIRPPYTFAIKSTSRFPSEVT